MKIGYNLKDQKERELFMQKYTERKAKEYRIANSEEQSAQQRYKEIVKERQEDYQYFINREIEKAEIEKQIVKQIEDNIPNEIEKSIQQIIGTIKVVK